MKKFCIVAFLLLVSLSIGALDYLMIGPKSFGPTCSPLLMLRANQGFGTQYMAVEDIWADPVYNGVDEQEEIRNAIRAMYLNHGLKYVVIVGDTNLVPVRHVIIAEDIHFKNATGSAIVHASAPSDIYYSCLSDSFNSDGDSRWGEMYDGQGNTLLDLTLHVAVGRIAAGNIRELKNQIYKIISHEIVPH